MDTKKLGSGGAAPDNDYPVVIPDNMGKGHSWNSTTNQYDIDVRDANGVKLNPDGSVGLAVSTDAGNLIQLRDNGVYYGISPKPNVQKLYLANDGNDSNDGTRESPLATVGEALRRIVASNSVGSFTIALKAGHTFRFPDDRVNFWYGTMTINFVFWGDSIYQDWDTNHGATYEPAAASDLNRPTLIFGSYSTQGVTILSGFADVDELSFYGLNVNFDFQQDSTGGYWGNYAKSQLIFKGCVIKVPSFGGIGSAQIVRLMYSQFTNTTSEKRFFIADFNPYIYHGTITDLSTKSDQGFPVYTPIEDNIEKTLTKDNICALATYDANTKSTFGFSTNWDIFKHS